MPSTSFCAIPTPALNSKTAQRYALIDNGMMYINKNKIAMNTFALVFIF